MSVQPSKGFKMYFPKIKCLAGFFILISYYNIDWVTKFVNLSIFANGKFVLLYFVAHPENNKGYINLKHIWVGITLFKGATNWSLSMHFMTIGVFWLFGCMTVWLFDLKSEKL